PSSTLTRGPPPGPAAATTSACPSPSASAAATHTPPRNPGSIARKRPRDWPVTPLNSPTTGPPPGPGPVTTSAPPSPSTSPPRPRHARPPAVPLALPGRAGAPAPEARLVGEKPAAHRPPPPVEPPPLGAAPPPGPGDDVRPPVPGHVPDGHAHPAAEVRGVG